MFVIEFMHESSLLILSFFYHFVFELLSAAFSFYDAVNMHIKTTQA